MPIVIETKEEFFARHGGDTFAGSLVQVAPNRWLLPDGASIELGANRDPVHVEPPADPHARLELRRKFHQAKAVIFESAFAALKNSLLGNGSLFNWDHRRYGPDPGGDGRPAMLQLRALAADQRRRAAALTAEIENLPEVRAAKQRAAERMQWEAEQQRQRQAFIDEIRTIELEVTEFPS